MKFYIYVKVIIFVGCDFIEGVLVVVGFGVKVGLVVVCISCHVVIGLCLIVLFAVSKFCFIVSIWIFLIATFY